MFIHTKYEEPIVIMVFRCAMQKVLCVTPPPPPLASRRTVEIVVGDGMREVGKYLIICAPPYNAPYKPPYK
jgi:hypothetical protein